MGYISQKVKQPTDDYHLPEKILFWENIESIWRPSSVVRLNEQNWTLENLKQEINTGHLKRHSATPPILPGLPGLPGQDNKPLRKHSHTRIQGRDGLTTENRNLYDFISVSSFTF